MVCRPEPTFCRPERSEGSLGAYALREDFTIRCPERSGRCLAKARQDRWGRDTVPKEVRDASLMLGRTDGVERDC
jgi:hypothetical protein